MQRNNKIVPCNIGTIYFNKNIKLNMCDEFLIDANTCGIQDAILTNMITFSMFN